MVCGFFVGLVELSHSLSSLSSKLNSSNDLHSSGAFEWHDSVLVEAITRGRWLLIENAHICNASVLDRLNSLLEPDGSLTVTERGVIDGESVVLRPHANFRLILSTNMMNKEISRAMRNRGVVISIRHPSTQVI